MRVVADTNVWVSALWRPGGVSWRALGRILEAHTPLVTLATQQELAEVFGRPYFREKFDSREVARFFRALREAAEFVEVGAPMRLCRDEKDDKFLEAAHYGLADVLVTGDKDLLAHHPFGRTRVLDPAAFLALPESTPS